MVTLLSTFHKSGDVDSEHEKKLTEMIKDYNRTMGGITITVQAGVAIPQTIRINR